MSKARRAIRNAAIALALTSAATPALALDKPVNAPAPERIAREGAGLKTAIFAGGCFWGVEGVFSHIKGVKSAESGYHGGAAATAKYNRITAGGTNHAEAVRITYDPYVIRYDELLRIFFSVVADPTLLNRQGPDVGAHYRSALVPTSAEQRAVAEAYLAQMDASGIWGRPIVTKVERMRTFYAAEDYHQDYMVKNPRSPYIVRWDAPKVEALRVMFPSDFRDSFLRDG
ncbi:possible peptide methionine sulfoxide reductase [Erythrobacter sp. NAP1]|uniref:peptide-methionine (S)-S-oxide reductase MsrA n=1 Tax=Erythrobacter sp. NAP1 TaxID=237727 RepID=UPI0000687603|nr:peptide-methionine (S)-S-oxide reductase MsrA [Erythrobacter sp. NAP1]EAQ28617.1 possible peptide methionine sulfoxide reductase [Erythrobacter sp. NAP1]